MTGPILQSAGTEPGRPHPGFDESRLAEWMVANVAGYHGPMTVERFSGGQSNPTYKLATPGHDYVLRRKPLGPVLKGAHAVDREARVLTALESTAFPVPHVFGLCTDDTVIGTAFYVMDMVAGRIFWDATLPELTRVERPAYFEEMARTLARLHRTDYTAIGLCDYGRAGNYFQRQIDRWSAQYQADELAGGDSNLDRLIEWLRENIPLQDETAIVHGDFRCDNVIFHPTEPRILAVLDWELSTLGDPIADFAYSAMMYRMPPQIVAGLAGSDLAALNIPDEDAYIAAYCRHSGRDAIPHYDFYLAFNFFRLAAIFHGIKGRVLRGNAASAQARERVKMFPELAALAWAQTGQA
jgi:aminoglycoside phosphotransferase (APT) family kinase protein